MTDKTMFHSEIADKWPTFTIHAQMANIGVEVGRICKFRLKNEQMAQNALYRTIELLDMTIQDRKNRKSLKELCRLKEIVIDFTLGDNTYSYTEKDWDRYFLPFQIAARK